MENGDKKQKGDVIPVVVVTEKEKDSEEYNVILPEFPSEKGKEEKIEIPSQRWVTEKLAGSDPFHFGNDPWTIYGEVIVTFGWGYGYQEPVKIAELRFGEHPGKRGFGAVCLWAKFRGDDKHNFEKIVWRGLSQTICGKTNNNHDVIFCVHPFQLSRLMKLQAALGKDVCSDDFNFINHHMEQCRALNFQYGK